MQRSTRYAWITIATGLAVACGDAPTAPRDGAAFAVVVSDAVGPAAASAAAATGAITPNLASVDRLAFVSVVPGTEPDGSSATIVNRRTQASVTAPMVDGGFDPAGIPAEAGDTLDITIARSSGGPVFARSTVPAARPPRVVRTSPARGRTDVAINATIAVIFSEPLDPRTVDATSLRVMKNGVAISGTVRPIPGSGVGIEFVPSSPLIPGSTYELLLGNSISDLSGDRLTGAVASEFTTVSSSAAGTLTFVVQPSFAYAFTPFGSVISVAAYTGAGNPDTTFTGTVSLTLERLIPGTAGLIGTSSVTAVRGVARFPDVAVSEGGTYTLHATSGGLSGGSSNPFGVVPSPWVAKAAPSSARTGPAMAAADGRLYLIGGSADAFGENGVADAEVYDPGTNSWASLPPMPTPRARLALGVINGIVYAVGGSNAHVSLSTVEAYNPATGTWTTKAPMPTPRAGLAVAVVDGTLYALGAFPEPLNTVEAYDPVTDRWSARAPLLSDMPSVAVVAGRIYNVQGLEPWYGESWQVDVYDPAADMWGTMGSHAEAAWGSRNALGVVGNRIYVNDQGGPSVAVYDASRNAWGPVPSLPGEVEAAGSVIAGVVYAIRGGRLYALTGDPCLGCWDY